jgi:Tfp pilus assembly protein PilN
LSAAQQDLADLRRQYDAQPYQLLLTGTTEDQSALHRYLADLAQCRLFRRVELQSVDARDARSDAAATLWEFQIAVTIAPSVPPYGPPGRSDNLAARGGGASGGGSP